MNHLRSRTCASSHPHGSIHGLPNQGLNSGVAMVRAVAANLKKCGFNHSFRRGEPCFLPRSYPAERMIWKSIRFSLGWSLNGVFPHRFVYWRVTSIEQPNSKRWFCDISQKECPWVIQDRCLTSHLDWSHLTESRTLFVGEISRFLPKPPFWLVTVWTRVAY